MILQNYNKNINYFVEYYIIKSLFVIFSLIKKKTMYILNNI